MKTKQVTKNIYLWMLFFLFAFCGLKILEEFYYAAYRFDIYSILSIFVWINYGIICIPEDRKKRRKNGTEISNHN